MVKADLDLVRSQSFQGVSQMRLTASLVCLLAVTGMASLVGCGKSESAKPTKPQADIGKPAEAGSQGPVGGGADVPADKGADTGAATDKPAADATTEAPKSDETPAKTEDKPVEEKKEDAKPTEEKKE